jgi:hypothetical protein
LFRFQEVSIVTQQSVVGVYHSLDRAEAAVEALHKGGFPIEKVSIVAKDIQDEKRIRGFVTACDVAKSGATTGAWIGGIFGVLIGAAFVWVPGVGPMIVAGSLAAVLAGGAEGAMLGAATGGILSGLASWGISKEHILKFENHVKAGKYLVIAHGSAEDVAKAHDLLTKQSEPAELTTHAAPVA